MFLVDWFFGALGYLGKVFFFQTCFTHLYHHNRSLPSIKRLFATNIDPVRKKYFLMPSDFSFTSK